MQASKEWSYQKYFTGCEWEEINYKDVLEKWNTLVTYISRCISKFSLKRHLYHLHQIRYVNLKKSVAAYSLGWKFSTIYKAPPNDEWDLGLSMWISHGERYSHL